MRKVCYGYYGMDNFGDDMFLYSMSKTNFENIKLVALCPEIKGVENIEFAVKPKNVHLYRNKEKKGKFYRFKLITKEYLICQEFSYIGGSTLSSDTSINMLKYLNILSSLVKRKLTAEGVSIGPFNNNKDKKEVIKFLKKFDNIIVRDEDSYKIGIENGLKNIRLGRDLVLNTEKIDIKNEDSLVVSLIRYETLNSLSDDDEATRNKNIFEAVRKICEDDKKLKIDIVCLNSDVDRGDNKISLEFYNALRESVPNEITFTEYKNNLEEVLEIFSSAKAVLTSRLHGGIISKAFGKPFILIEYHKKCTDFLNDINLPLDMRVSRIVDSCETVQYKIKNILYK